MGAEWGKRPGDRPLPMKARIALGVVATGALIGLSCQGPEPMTHRTVGTSSTSTTTCAEDMPCWDCSTMGNRICGPLPSTG